MNLRDYKRPHRVYLLRGEGTNYFKIGMSLNPERRRKAFSTPFELVPVAQFMAMDRYQALDIEQKLHRLYADRHLRGEWFRDIDAKDFIDDAEYLALKMDAALLKKYGQKQSLESSRDQRVLEALKSGGIDAARKESEYGKT